jgi:predicted TIM-barrel fold metal-dependent hydrolase
MPGVDLLSQLGAADWTDVTAQQFVHASQRARFDLSAAASRRALAGDLAAGNAEVKALLDQAPQARGWVVVNTNFPERSSEEMKRYASGSKWLGALLSQGPHGGRLASQATRDVLQAYRRYSKPVLVPIPDAAAAHDLQELAGEFSNVKFVAQGCGGDDWQDAVLAARVCVNIFLEPCSGGPHRGKIEAIFAALGPNRVVFASNYPDQNPGAALGLLLEAKITDSERQAMLSGNAIRLFGLRREE